MISTSKYNFKTEEDLAIFIMELISGKNVVIMGGHYILIYNDIGKRLEPAIWQENSIDHIKQLSLMIAGNFPLRTFNLALRIRNEHEQRGFTGLIALLVNDHLFQSKAFSNIKNKNNVDWGLQKQIYFKSQDIPEIYNKIIANHNINKERVFIKNTLINSRYYNPILFSETALRKKFDRKLKASLSISKGFYLKQLANAKSELYFKGLEGNYKCLTEEGACGCSGEVMQFIWEILQTENDCLIMFVPQECYDSVCIGVEAFLEQINKKKTYDFFIVTGLGDNDFLNLTLNDTILLTYYKTS